MFDFREISTAAKMESCQASMGYTAVGSIINW